MRLLVRGRHGGGGGQRGGFSRGNAAHAGRHGGGGYNHARHDHHGGNVNVDVNKDVRVGGGYYDHDDNTFGKALVGSMIGAGIANRINDANDN